MDRVTQQQLETKLRESRREMESQWCAADGSAGDPDHPLEKVWRRALRSQMREIDAALERLTGDGYGACEQCGEPISVQRLYAIPWARQCFRCQTARPQENARLLRCGRVPTYWY